MGGDLGFFASVSFCGFETGAELVFFASDLCDFQTPLPPGNWTSPPPLNGISRATSKKTVFLRKKVSALGKFFPGKAKALYKVSSCREFRVKNCWLTDGKTGQNIIEGHESSGIFRKECIQERAYFTVVSAHQSFPCFRRLCSPRGFLPECR